MSRKYVVKVTVSYPLYGVKEVEGERKLTEIGKYVFYYRRAYFQKKPPKLKAIKQFMNRARRHARSHIRRANKRYKKLHINLVKERTSVEKPTAVLRAFSKKYTEWRGVRHIKSRSYWFTYRRKDDSRWKRIKR